MFNRSIFRAFLPTVGVFFAAAWAQPSPTTLPDSEIGRPNANKNRVSAKTLIVKDSFDVPHICAQNDLDAIFGLGYLHAQDRFFQMDLLRRRFSGTAAELLGEAVLGSDVEMRNLGIRRSAEESLVALQEEGLVDSLAALDAYAQGVNSYISSHPLPPEYGALELTSVAPWDVVDSLTVLKGTVFELSFSLVDLSLTQVASVYEQAGEAGGFDGMALLFEDAFRVSPFDPTVTAPGRLANTDSAPSSAEKSAQAAADPTATTLAKMPAPEPRVADLARQTEERLAKVPTLQPALDPARGGLGSNWWLVDGAHSVSGKAMLASDSHLQLGTPATFYEAHLMTSEATRCDIPPNDWTEVDGGTVIFGGTVAADSQVSTSLNVNGMTIPGFPGVVMGCNDKMCWGLTVNPVDVTDIYQELLVVDPQTGLPSHTIFEGRPEPVELIAHSFRVNQVGDGKTDHLTTADLAGDEGGLTIIVPRRNRGPLIGVSLDDGEPLGLSVQFTGSRGTTELETFLRLPRVDTIDSFKQALQFYDTGSMNWAYADVAGNIAYFSSGEIPIREDLQTLNQPDGGISPMMVRDGTHNLKHEWMATTHPQPRQRLEFEILLFDEMPQEINPTRGYIASANNDPIGTNVDNNPWNQTRSAGGSLYLGSFYSGIRIGRIDRMIQSGLEGGGKISRQDMQRMQGDNHLLDAEVLAPFLINAFARAGRDDAPTELKTIARSPRIEEAVARLTAWDYSTPTGIAQGYDPDDDPFNLPQPSDQEISNSVAASIWAIYRSALVERLLVVPQSSLGLGGYVIAGFNSAAHLLQNWHEDQGVGASGFYFFETGTDLGPADERDLVLLQTLATALDRLAGPQLAPAFGGSTDQDDYRWGLLHRIVFSHPLGQPFSVPSAAGFEPVSPQLPGVAKAGGMGVVDASEHDALASEPDDFMFSDGPVRRFVGVMDPQGIEAYDVLPGGQSGVPGDPDYASQLALWLTNGYHPVLLSPQAVAGDIKEEFELGDDSGGDCVPTPTTLCLQNNRFAVSIDWQSPSNRSGQGMVVAGASQSSGNFAFFSVEHWKMLVKVLDGCDYNGHFWVFASGATDVEWQLRVQDTSNGASWSAMNPQGTRSPAITAVEAFQCP